MSTQAFDHSPSYPPAAPAHELLFSQEQLCDAVCSYYSQLRSEQLPSLTQHIPTEFARIQQQVMEVVELRKNMERVLEVEAMQAQHFPTVHRLLELSNQQEQSIAQMAAHIKHIESRNMDAYLEALQKDRLERTTGGNEIIERGHQLVLQLKDFKRTFSINTGAFPQPQEEEVQSETEAQGWQHEEHFEQLMRWQRRRWELARYIYSVKFKEISLRDELLEERERVQGDFERASHELIDTLLREKERDKNLRKKDNEKFGEIIKQRDEIDLENQNLNHSEKTLLPHLQNELLRMKRKLREQEEKHGLEQQKWQKKGDDLAKELQQATVESKAKDVAYQEKEAMHRQKFNELKTALEASGESRRAAEGSLKAGRAEIELELERAKSRGRQLEHENAQLLAKNEHLQSQYSELILKSSQLNQIRGDLAHKFEKAAKRAQQLETKLEELKTNLDSKDEELRNLQGSLRTLNSEKEHYQAIISQLEGDLSSQKEYLRLYVNKAISLESELAQKFILHNEERTNLLLELDQKSQAIGQLNCQLLQAKQKAETTSSASPPDTGSLSPTLLESIRQEIMEELARSEKAKLQLIDSFVGRIQDLV